MIFLNRICIMIQLRTTYLMLNCVYTEVEWRGSGNQCFSSIEEASIGRCLEICMLSLLMESFCDPIL